MNCAIADPVQLRLSPPPKRHRLASSVNFQLMVCGKEFVDPAGEWWTTDPALVTCGGCLRTYQARQKRRVAARAGKVGV